MRLQVHCTRDHLWFLYVVWETLSNNRLLVRLNIAKALLSHWKNLTVLLKGEVAAFESRKP